jgi:hypothetical protein
MKNCAAEILRLIRRFAAGFDTVPLGAVQLTHQPPLAQPVLFRRESAGVRKARLSVE